jgi:hypothetical protein
VDESFRSLTPLSSVDVALKTSIMKTHVLLKTTSRWANDCNQTLSVNTGRNQADYLTSMQLHCTDKLNNAELLVNFTRKGVGLTIQGKLTTDVVIQQLTLEVNVDGCQEIVDEFISFLRGSGFMDASIYAAMENAVEEYSSYQAQLEKAIELSMSRPRQDVKLPTTHL